MRGWLVLGLVILAVCGVAYVGHLVAVRNAVNSARVEWELKAQIKLEKAQREARDAEANLKMWRRMDDASVKVLGERLAAQPSSSRCIDGPEFGTLDKWMRDKATVP